MSEGLPRFDKVMKTTFRTTQDGADTAVWLVATRPDSRDSTHFWHDRALRPTTWGWQRDQEPARVRRFLDRVTAATATDAADYHV